MKGLPQGFEDPWEHVRLLSDASRNRVLVELLRRHVTPGARVLEVGCGTGVLSCLAARMGAARVYAVEPTALADQARRLVDQNRLGGVVEVLDGMVEDLDPRPVDLAFSELLNADPFLEGLLPASDAAASWLAPGGVLAPGRLRILAAPVVGVASTAEAVAARRELQRLGGAAGVDLGAAVRHVGDAGTYRYVAEVDDLAGSAVVVWDVELGRGWRPPDELELDLQAAAGADVGGVAVWFEAEYAPGSWLANPPGEGGHWGQLVCGWSDPPRGRKLRVRVEVEEDELTVHPA